MVDVLPSFLLVGPPRTGTSWLHEVLSQHALLPRSSKETRFFDTYFHRGVGWYRAHYRRTNGACRMGEVAPTYFCSQTAREHIARLLPHVKIVCTFRDPVERVLSLYRVKRAYGLIPWNFEEALVRDPELMESSRYATNLKAWQRMFGPQQVLATVYEDLRDKPQTYVENLADFIGVPRFRLTDSQAGRVHGSEGMTLPRNYHRTRSATLMAEWFKAQHLGKVVSAVKKSSFIKIFLGGGAAFGELSRDVVQKLYELFQPEIEELEVMLNRDFSAWKPVPARIGAEAGV
jgi:Sulfotransferase domain